MVSFNNIPNDIRTPGAFTEFDNSRAVQGTPTQPHVALMIGILKTSGSTPANTPQLVGSGDAAEGYFGIGSMVAEMCKAFKNANPYTELRAIGLAETTTAATTTLTVGGAATEDGTVVTYIAGHRIETAVTSGDAAAAISVAQNAAILAYTNYLRLPYTSGQATVVTTLTAVHKGVYGNELEVAHSLGDTEKLPAGVTLTIAAGVTGAGIEDMSAAITAMGDVQYNTIAIAATDSTTLTAIVAEMTTRDGPMIQKDGHVFAAALGTQSTLVTLGNGQNSQFLTIVSAGGISNNSQTPLYKVAATAAAVRAAQMEIDPARPLQTLELPGVLPPPPADQFDRSERQTLLTDGIATTKVDDSGLVRIERLITTYQTNPLSIPDPSYLDITTRNTLSTLRFETNAYFGLKYPRHKLASDGEIFDSGQAIVTPSTLKAEFLVLFLIWRGRALVEGYDQFKADLIVTRNTSDVNRVDWRASPNLVNGLRVMAGQIQFLS